MYLRSFYLFKRIVNMYYIRVTLFRVSATFYLCQCELGGAPSINQSRFVQAHYAVLPPSYWDKIRSYRRENPVQRFSPYITFVVKPLILTTQYVFACLVAGRNPHASVCFISVMNPDPFSNTKCFWTTLESFAKCGTKFKPLDVNYTVAWSYLPSSPQIGSFPVDGRF